MFTASWTEPGYPVSSVAEAESRADAVLAEVGLDTDVGLDDRLRRVLGEWMDESAASVLGAEARHLYRLLTSAERTVPDKPVDAEVLRLAVVLAMTRPEADPCWQDYQALVAAIAQCHQSAPTPSLLTRAWRKLTRREPARAEVNARAQSLIEARKHFTDTWR